MYKMMEYNTPKNIDLKKCVSHSDIVFGYDIQLLIGYLFIMAIYIGSVY